MCAGVPAGAYTPQTHVRSTLTANSISVGASGKIGDRVFPGTASSCGLLDLRYGCAEVHGEVQPTRKQVHHDLLRALIRHVHGLKLGRVHDHFDGDMLQRAGAGGPVIELAGIGTGVGEELRHVAPRDAGMRNQEQRVPAVGATGNSSFVTSVSILTRCGLMRSGPSDECSSV